MKNAQDMYTLTQETKSRLTKERSIGVVLIQVERIIKHAAERGETNVRIKTEEMGFNPHFPVTISNMNIISERVKAFDYKTHVLLEEATSELSLYVDWAPNLLEEAFRAFGGSFEARY